MPPIQDEVVGWWNWAQRNLPVWQRDTEKIIIKEIREMNSRSGQLFVRLAGLSGAIAVSLGAYGAHVFKAETSDPTLKRVFETGNQYHLLHSVALLAVPVTRRPYIVGPLMATGLLLFSGSCYYHAFTGSIAVRRVTPYGGMLLIAAWLAMVV